VAYPKEPPCYSDAAARTNSPNPSASRPRSSVTLIAADSTARPAREPAHDRADHPANPATHHDREAGGASVKSPVLGDMAAGPFVDRLAAASAHECHHADRSLPDQLRPESCHRVFQYDWTARDPTLITFKVMDLFTFEPDSGKITYLDITYDTHPIRASARNTYQL
jgi:hypothetical protein